MNINFQKRKWFTVGGIGVMILFFTASCVYYSLTPARFLTQLTRVIAAPVFAVLYASDIRDMEYIVNQYKIGSLDHSLSDNMQTWRNLESTIPGFRLRDFTPIRIPNRKARFVYEMADAPHLSRFRETYDLGSVIRDTASQYEAMLKLGAWVGTRFDHGIDVGSRYACDPTGLIAAGEQGAKYWCEIAARVTVQAASSLGWPARIITASRDGYSWDHGVAELWSDDFGKWFVMDTDFNVVYESNGVPLSAFELSRDGPSLQRVGNLDVIAIAPPKPGLVMGGADMMPYYRYVHIDMRNDWCTRPLRRGSPAGGDLATWWTARPDMPPLLNARRRVDEADSFDWTLNAVAVSVVAAQLLDDGHLRLEVAFSVESPVFTRFEARLNDVPWEPVKNNTASWVISSGDHTIAARMITVAGNAGMETFVTFSIRN